MFNEQDLLLSPISMEADQESILDSIRDAVITLDADGYVQYCNAGAAEVTGYAAEELVNKPFSLLYGGAAERIKAEYEMGLAAKHGKYTSEGWKYTKDGTRFWAEVVLYHKITGARSGFSCLLRDVTPRKMDDIALRKSEERYRLMVEGVKEYAIFMLSPTGHIMTWNDGAKRIKGYSPSEIIGKHFSIFYTAEDLETRKPQRELEIATATGKYEEEGWRVKKNGSVFWANVVLTSLFNEQNQLIGFSKVTRDLTERKENEEELRQSEERFRSLVEQVIDYGIFMMDEKGRIISWNEGARRISGYEATEIIGKYFSMFYPEEDILNGKPSHELNVARTEGKYEEEGWRIRKDGTRFWASVIINAVYTNDGGLIGFSKVTRDLTERKAAENALRESYDKYRHIAEELRVTNENLSVVNNELEQFTSVASHDLQEPIRSIKSFMRLIDMRVKEQKYDDLEGYLAKSIAAADRMRELINNLLQYTQLGTSEVGMEEVPMNDLLNEVLQDVRTAIDAGDVKITVENEVHMFHGNRTQLHQLFQNIIGNAVKFTDKKKPTVAITCKREDGFVKCSVCDNGIGIAPEDTGKIFEIFKRLHTKKQFPGTGIGLAICKKIVELYNGRIWVESVKGEGTTFYFTLQDSTAA